MASDAVWCAGHKLRDWASGGGYSIGYNVREKRGYYSYRHH